MEMRNFSLYNVIYLLNLFLHINLFSVLGELSARHKQLSDEWHVIQDSQGLAVSFEQPYTKEADCGSCCSRFSQLLSRGIIMKVTLYLELLSVEKEKAQVSLDAWYGEGV